MQKSVHKLFKKAKMGAGGQAGTGEQDESDRV
jgi:hypothetical protein